MSDPVAARNTDRELWREREGDYYSPRLFVTEGGGIGMDVGGHVVVKPIREWHKLPASEMAWRIMYKQETRYANLPTSEREATLQKALESTTADQIKAEEESERLRLENGHLLNALEQANDVCRSAYQIAERRGKNTAWPEFKAKLGAALGNQHQILNPRAGADSMTKGETGAARGPIPADVERTAGSIPATGAKLKPLFSTEWERDDYEREQRGEKPLGPRFP